MRHGWPRKALGDLCAFRNGINFTKASKGCSVKIFGVKDFQQNFWAPLDELETVTIDDSLPESDLLKDNDLLFVRSNGNIELIGRCVLVGKVREQISHSGFTIRARLHTDEVDPRFLCHFLKTERVRREMIEGGIGTNIKSLNQATLADLSIPTPPLSEQRRIIGILDEALDGIATAKANAEANCQNARALFESHRNAVFSRRGEGWKERTVDQLSLNLDSKRIPITKSDRTRGKFPYYGASGIVDYVSDYIFDGDALLVSEDGANLLMRSTPIAFSVSGKYWVNNHAHILKFENMATQRFVEYHLESIKLDEYITGTAQPKLNQKALNSIPIPIPESVEAQAEVVRSIESIAAEARRLEATYQRKLAALDELKKSLLYRAFSGQL